MTKACTLHTILLAALLPLVLFLEMIYPLSSGAAENPVIRVKETDSGLNSVTIKAQQVSLPDLLDKIATQSGIDFKVRGSMMKESISVDVQAENWTEAVQKVLVDYSRVELWGRDKMLTGVYVLEPLNPEDDPNLRTNFNEANNRKAVRTSQASDDRIRLSKGQLVRLIKGPYRSPLAPQLWKDEKLRGFLEQHGINAPEDLNNLQKAMTLRKAARWELRNFKKKRP